MKHQEVVRFACGLTPQTKTVLSFVYDTWVQTIIHVSSISSTDTSYLSLLWQEVSEFATVDPLHNQYFNYIDSIGCSSTKFVGSGFYVFELDDDVDIDWSVVRSRLKSSMVDNCSPSAECIIRAKGDNQWRSTKQLIQEIKQYQSICTVDLYKQGADSTSEFLCSNDTLTGEIDDCFGEAIKISKNVKSFALRRGSIPISVTQKLHDCQNLEKLHLSNTTGLPAKLGDSIATMTSIKELQMQYCDMTSHVSGMILKGISHCSTLVELNLSFNTLTDCLERLFGSYGFFSLKTLEIEKTNLSKADVKCLGQALHSNKLPKLEALDLSSNTLTDCVGDLLGGQGVPCLEWLWLWNTKLSRADVDIVSAAVSSGKVPHLRYLHLEHNRLCTMQDAVQDLIEVCVDQYKQTELIIDLYHNGLSGAFRREMKSLCQGTKVDLPPWVD